MAAPGYELQAELTVREWRLRTYLRCPSRTTDWDASVEHRERRARYRVCKCRRRRAASQAQGLARGESEVERVQVSERPGARQGREETGGLGPRKRNAPVHTRYA